MANEKHLDQRTLLQCSSVIENAPYVVAESTGELFDGKYTSMYSLKCASCQSKSCAGPRRGIEKKV